MHPRRIPLRVALLGSALALAALTPAIGANASRDEAKRILAAEGKHPSALRQNISRASVHAAATYTVLHDFAGAPNDGANPGGGFGGGVTLDGAGNIYGTTDAGGAANQGVIFKLAPDGTQTLLHSFGSAGDGSGPDGAVTLLSNGDLYGTTEAGGSSGNGVLYRLAASGKYKILHSFAASDGNSARGRLVRDKLGNFYGTALFGGANGDGTVFKYGSDGTFTVLHAFNGTDGEFPEHGLARDSAGNLYGVTAFGGTSGEGTVFEIASDGTFSTVYNFTGGADGGFLYGTVAIGKDGNIYGNTASGGANGEGTVFKLTPGGKLTTLYNFTGGSDGGSPQGDMLVAGANLYSTASAGGDPSCQCGVIYAVTAKGNEKVLHAFTGSDGAGYSSGVIKSNGLFYGTTASGGAHNDGVVFSVTKK
jgi:uncharacterized repeat protein (TIGR03803 family)